MLRCGEAPKARARLLSWKFRNQKPPTGLPRCAASPWPTLCGTQKPRMPVRGFILVSAPGANDQRAVGDCGAWIRTYWIKHQRPEGFGPGRRLEELDKSKKNSCCAPIPKAEYRGYKLGFYSWRSIWLRKRSVAVVPRARRIRKPTESLPAS